MCLPVLAALAPAAAGAAGAAGMAGLSTALSIGSGVIGAAGAIAQGMAARNAAKRNAQIQERAAEDAYRRGEEQSQDKRREAARVRDRQAAAIAANGGDATFGSNAELLAETELLGERDAFRIRESARKQAEGHDFEAAQHRAEASQAMPNAMMNAAGTLLTTGSAVAGRWAKWKTPAPTPSFAPGGLY